jgi:hypothetical protein
MTVSMYKISVPIFVQFLTSLSAVLDKAAAHCEAKKIEPSALLNARLFSRHVSVRSPGARRDRSRRQRHGAPLRRAAGARQCGSKLCGAHAASRQGDRICQKFQADADRWQRGKNIKITFPSGATGDFAGQSPLLNNALPNFYFHCTTATTSYAGAAWSSASAISWNAGFALAD